MARKWRVMNLHSPCLPTILFLVVALSLLAVVHLLPPSSELTLAATLFVAAAVIFGCGYLVSRLTAGHFSISKSKEYAEPSRVLLEVTRTINSSLDVKVILQHAVDLAREHLKADYGEIHYMKRPEEHGVRFSGLEQGGGCHVKRRPTLRGLNGEILRTGRPLRLADRSEHPHSVPLPEGHPPFGPFLGVPIIVQGEVVADILLIRTPGKKPFTQEDENFLLTIANHAAVAVENARLYTKVRHIAALEERDRIGREMHDGLAQTLGYLNLRTCAALDLITEGKHDDARNILVDIRRVIEEAYEDVRRAIFDLRNGPDLNLGFIPSLREYLYEFTLHTHIDTELLVDDEKRFDLPPEVEVQLVRIIQEALTNVRKHSQADRAWIRIETGRTSHRIIVEDNGVGFKHETDSRPLGRPHFGLQTMCERAESVGGCLEIESHPGNGTRVVVTVPAGEHRVRLLPPEE